MKKIIVFAALALTPGIAVAADNVELNGLGKDEVAAIDISGLAMPQVPVINKIVGGAVAVKGEFPFLVSLQDLAGHFCGGALIAKDWVLTAEHCVADGVGTVVIGLHDLRETAGTERFQVDRVVPHPLRSAQDYDYALLHLSGESKFTPIALNRAKISKNVNLFTAGWGDTAEAGGMQENFLHKVTVPFVSAERCSAVYPGWITDRMICAGYDAGGKDACQGDSGGPLFMGSGARRTLVGVVSWGNGCARPNFYGVYSKVNVVTEWIDSVIKK